MTREYSAAPQDTFHQLNGESTMVEEEMMVANYSVLYQMTVNPKN